MNLNLNFCSTMGSEIKGGGGYPIEKNFRNATSTHFNFPTSKVVLPSPMPFENRLARMLGEVDVKDGIGAKPSNDFAKEPHGEEKVIIIDIREEYRYMFKQF